MVEALISSRENPRVRFVRRLHQARARRAEGLLPAEGVRLLGDAWAAGSVPLEVFFEPGALRNNPGASELIVQFERARVPCFPVTPAVLAELSETVTPQGICAVLRLPELAVNPRPTLALILDGVRDPGNAGTLLRTAEAVGADVVLFGPGTVDAFNGKVVRAAMGAHFRQPLREFRAWNEELALWLPDVEYFVAEMDASLDYDAVDWRLPAALIVGGEAGGPSDAARARATPVRIPMLGRTESLNAAMAGAVILFEAARRRRQRPG